MATLYDETDGVVISGDDARGGETGHHVRYILAAGLTGVIAAFAGVAIYFGYDRLHANLAAAFARSPFEMLQAVGPYAGLLLAGAVITGLLLGAWNMLAGRSEDGSQAFMRFRVVAQFALIVVIMAMLYVSAG
ncbi:MAG: HIG1 domain-containing protein [Hyphomicrobium sp.]|nr:HIG1 domain-containing protein [Hyphomicrobium sp.]